MKKYIIISLLVVFFTSCGSEVNTTETKEEPANETKVELTEAQLKNSDIQTGKILDKDIFRQELGSLVEGYTEVLTRMKGI